MEFAAEKEGTPGGGPQRVADGARLRPATAGEGARDLDGSPEAGDGEERNGLTGIKTTEDAEEIKMDLAVVKQEVVDWSDLDDGISDSHCVKQEVEGGPEVKQEADSSLVVKEEEVDEPEVKEEKVKVKEEVTDWEEVEDLNVKQELFVGQNVKEEQVMDGVPVKEEDCLKREVMEDTKVKEEPQMNPQVGCKRKLAMSR